MPSTPTSISLSIPVRVPLLTPGAGAMKATFEGVDHRVTNAATSTVRPMPASSAFKL